MSPGSAGIGSFGVTGPASIGGNVGIAVGVGTGGGPRTVPIRLIVGAVIAMPTGVITIELAPDVREMVSGALSTMVPIGP